MASCHNQSFIGIVCTIIWLAFAVGGLRGEQQFLEQQRFANAPPSQESADASLETHMPISEVRQVLLRNGNMIAGSIVPSGMHLKVRQSNGSEIILPKSDVDATFQTADGVYHYLASRLKEDDLQSHQKLFHWCMRYRLWQQAEQTLVRLQSTRISATQWLQLQSQLETARRPLPERAQVVAVTQVEFRDLPPTSAIVTAEVPTIADDDPDSQFIDLDPLVRPVSFESAPINRQYLLSESELNRLVTAVTPETWRDFQLHIEPILLRDCNNAGCHESNKRQLTLIDTGIERTNPTRLSQQNLYRALQFLEPHVPANQSLLAMAQSPHANQLSPAWSADSRELELLKTWIASLNDTHESVVDEFLQAAPRITPVTLTQNSSESFSQPPRDLNTQSSAVKSATPVTKPDINSTARQTSPSANTPKSSNDDLPAVPSLTADSRTFVPRDPFDPEIYNRFFWRSSPANGGDK